MKLLQIFSYFNLVPSVLLLLVAARIAYLAAARGISLIAALDFGIYASQFIFALSLVIEIKDWLPAIIISRIGLFLQPTLEVISYRD